MIDSSSKFTSKNEQISRCLGKAASGEIRSSAVRREISYYQSVSGKEPQRLVEQEIQQIFCYFKLLQIQLGKDSAISNANASLACKSLENRLESGIIVGESKTMSV